MLDRITRITEEFFGDVEDDGVTQGQREALIDLLICVLYADDVIKHEENARLDAVCASLTWENPLQLRQYLGMAYSRIRSALDDETAKAALLARLAERLGNADMRRKALGFAKDLAEVDGELDPREHALLSAVQDAFALV